MPEPVHLTTLASTRLTPRAPSYKILSAVYELSTYKTTLMDLIAKSDSSRDAAIMAGLGRAS